MSTQAKQKPEPIVTEIVSIIDDVLAEEFTSIKFERDTLRNALTELREVLLLADEKELLLVS
jgi:hypothetical protein